MTEGEQELMAALWKLLKRVNADIREFGAIIKEYCDQAQGIRQEQGEVYAANKPSNSKEVQLIVRAAGARAASRMAANKGSIRAHSEEQRLRKKLRAELSRLIAEVSK